MNKKLIGLLTMFLIFSFVIIVHAEDISPHIEWIKVLGGNVNDELYSIQPTADGGYIAAGYTNSTNDDAIRYREENYIWIIKLSNKGIVQWEKTISSSCDKETISILQTNDGGYVVTGTKNGGGTIIGSEDCVLVNNEKNIAVWMMKLSDQGNIEWQKTFGLNKKGVIFCIRQTNDSGYIFTGICSNDDEKHKNKEDVYCWIVKMNSQGSIEWEKILKDEVKRAKSIEQTKDGGYIVAGYSELNDSDASSNCKDSNVWVMKLTSKGNIEWEKNYGGSNKEEALSIKQTNDSGYIVTGWTNSKDGDVASNHGNGDVWVVKLTDEGTIEWERTYGGNKRDNAYNINQTTDGSYIITGITELSDINLINGDRWFDAWILKLSKKGNIEWEKTFGGSSFDQALLVEQTNDNEYIICGHTNSKDGNILGNHGKTDSWIMKLSHNDNIQWTKDLDFLNKDIVNRIVPRQQTSDGGYILDICTGLKNHDFRLVKLFKDGNIEWKKAFNGLDSDVVSDIKQSSDNGYIISVESYLKNLNSADASDNNNFWTAKLSSKGATEWEKRFNDGSYDEVYQVEQINDGGYIINGLSQIRDTKGHCTYTNWIKKLSKNGNLEWQKELSNSSSHYIYHTKKTNSEGVILVSEEGSDIYNIDCEVIKMTSKGNIEWKKKLGGSGWYKIDSVQQTNDGGYILAGHKRPNEDNKHSNPNKNDYWIVKLSNDGNIKWEKNFGGSSLDEAQYIKESSDGGYIVTGLTQSSDGDVTSHYEGIDAWIVKLSNQGNIEWEKTLGSSEHDEPLFIQESKDNGYIAIGYSKPNDIGKEQNYKFWMVKLSKDGTEEWQKPLSDNGYGKIHRILQTDNGEYIIISHNKPDDIGYWIFRHKPNNEEQSDDINYRVIKLKID